MEKQAFYQHVRAIGESIGPATQNIYDLLRTSGSTNPQDAAQVASDNFASFKAAQKTILSLRLSIEAEHRAARSRTNPDPSPHTYRLDILADLQNTMLWALLGDDSAAVNLSANLDVGFGYLSDRNISSVAQAAHVINDDPESFALIATSQRASLSLTSCTSRSPTSLGSRSCF
ncbi:MAG: hypothetical protein QOJ98_1988 [Acidobacteriota bacterium]|jgi:hypothetical protein|nr:hypothetical protein [Acidobacteriota bacterium]